MKQQIAPIKSRLEELCEVAKDLCNTSAYILDRQGIVVCGVAASRSPEFVALINRQKSQAVVSRVDQKDITAVPIGHNVTLYWLCVETKLSPSQTKLFRYYGRLLMENAKRILPDDSTDTWVARFLNEDQPAAFGLLAEEASALGYDVTVARFAIVLVLKDYSDRLLATLAESTFEREDIIRAWKKNIDTNLNAFFSAHADNIIAYLGNDTFLILKAINGDTPSVVFQTLKKSHQAIFGPLKTIGITSLGAGVGPVGANLLAYKESYREAARSVHFGLRLGGWNKTYTSEDLGVLRLINESDAGKHQTFVHQILGNLNDKNQLQTLQTFFDQNLSIADTAQKLGIHRNTVLYRLDQIANTIGYDPRSFDNALTIKFALLIRKLTPE